MEIQIYRTVKPVGLEAIGSESRVRHLFLMYLRLMMVGTH